MSGPVAKALLHWYRRHARALPWRAPPGAKAPPDPYRVWLSEVMLQQTTVAAVTPRFLRFLERWPTVEALAAAPAEDVLGEWAGLGYYARARNLHACAKAVATQGGFPDTEEGLRALPGVGAYTAAAIAAIAFDRRAIVVDGNVERVAARLFRIETPLPKAKPQLREAIASVWPARNSGDFAQALMDLGAMICTPKTPDCAHCPIAGACKAHAAGVAESLPRKSARQPRPTRRGVAYALVNARGEMLFETRADGGLLGGMLGLPGGGWDGTDTPAPPAEAEWRKAGTAEHVFTHFRLELDVFVAAAPKGLRLRKGQQWLAPDDARLPTAMAKAVKMAMG
jgi:A/G-specific adenine glycosylase